MDANFQSAAAQKTNRKTIAIVTIVILLALSAGYFLGKGNDATGYAVASNTTNSGHVQGLIGSVNAGSSIVEVCDYESEFCRKFYLELLPSLENDFVKTNRANIIFKDLPLNNIHTNARDAAEAARCANEQGKWREMHDILFDKQNDWSPIADAAGLKAKFLKMAGILEMDTSKFSACLDSEKYLGDIYRDAAESLAFGTFVVPAVYVNGVRIVNMQNYDSLKAEIEKNLPQ